MKLEQDPGWKHYFYTLATARVKAHVWFLWFPPRANRDSGVWLEDLAEGALLEVETQNRWYTIVIGTRGHELVSGHPQYCPEPVPVRIEGSTWGGSMLKLRFIGRGMRLEFRHPVYRTILTSPIVDIRASDQLVSNARAPQN